MSRLPRRGWVFAPDAGGKKIPDAVKERTEVRLRKYADEHFAGRFTRLDIRFRGQFCYIDAYTEPDVSPRASPCGSEETREQMIERLRNTPIHLCRLRYFGDEDGWGFAFYTYSNEKYELSMFPTDGIVCKPEESMEASSVYPC